MKIMAHVEEILSASAKPAPHSQTFAILMDLEDGNSLFLN